MRTKQKLILMLLALFTTLGAWATVTQPTLTTDADNPTYYVIQNFRSGKYANYAGASLQLQQVTTADAGTTSLWYFMENSDGVSIIPATAPDLKLESHSSATADGAVWYTLENPYKAGYFCVSRSSNASANCWDDQSGAIGYWQPAANDNDGTSWIIREVPVTKAEVDAGTVDLPFILKKLDALARLVPLASLSVYTDANVAAVRNAADATALNEALEAFETNISLFCRSEKYLVVGESACSYVATPSEYQEVIQLKSAGDGTFYLKGYNSKRYVGDVTASEAIGTDETPTTAFYFQKYNGYTVVRPSDTAASYDTYRYIHNGGSGCVGWEAAGVNTQHTIAEAEFPVTYHMMLNGVDVAQATVGNVVGATPSVPAALTYAYTTYDYDVATITANTTDVYVTPSFDLPFTLSTDFASATWYYATLRGKYLRADDSAKDGSGRYQTNSSNGHTDAYKWAFFGNPIQGIYVMNKNQGSDKYLYQSSQFTFETLANPAEEDNALFAVTHNSNGGFTLRSISGGANYYINDAGNGGNLGFWNNASGANDGGSNWVITEAGAVDKAALGDAIAAAQALVDGAGVPGYINSTAAATLNSAISPAQSVNEDPSGDYASAYNTLAAAIAEATVPANINYTPRTDVYYTIVNARGAMVYDPSHSESVDNQNGNAEYIWYGSTNPDATNPNNLWGFIERDGNYYMYNVGKRQFATVGHGTYGSTWIFSNTPAYITLDDGIADEIVPPGVRVRATIVTTGNSYTMSVSTSYTGPVITYDGNGDGGVPMVFAESTYAIDAEVTSVIEALIEDLTPYRNALKDVIDGCASLGFGTGLNQYTANDAYTTALAAANAAYENEDATKSDLQTAKSDLESAIDGLPINQPAAGSFLRVRSVSTGMGYVNAETVEAANRGNVLTVGSKGKSSIYYYQNGKLLAYNSGQYFIKNDKNFASLGETGDEGVSIVFGTGLKKRGTYTVIFGGRYLYAGDSATDTNAGGSEGDKHYDFWLEQVDALPVTINSIGGRGYASFYTPVSISSLPSGVKAYIATIENDRVQFSAIEAIPAGTAVVLYMPTCDANTTVELPIGDASESTEGNVLRGSEVAAAAPAGVLTMQNGSKGIGFYGFEGTLAGFKAYINSTSGIKGFSFDFEDSADGIETIQNAETNAHMNVYDLQGRKVNANGKLPKGIYIENGKKVLK